MKKQYVLDTNVLLYDPQAIFKFADNDVVISIAVIEEIDRFKKELTETGRNARMVSQYIDNLRSKGPFQRIRRRMKRFYWRRLGVKRWTKTLPLSSLPKIQTCAFWPTLSV
jgi:hypothetical protein